MGSILNARVAVGARKMAKPLESAFFSSILNAIVTVDASYCREACVKIGELANKTGCPVTRIRFYEQKGLLPEPRRTLGGQRNYSDDAVERLEFISICRANGMKLECIARFIEFEKDPSKGTKWLLDRIDDYIEQTKICRERLDKAEKYLFFLRSQFSDEAGSTAVPTISAPSKE